MRSVPRSSLIAFSAVVAWMPPATAQTGANFFRGKAVTYIGHGARRRL